MVTRASLASITLGHAAGLPRLDRGRRSLRSLALVLAAALSACDAAPAGGAGNATPSSVPSTAAATAAPSSSPTGGAHGAGPSASPTATPAPSPGAPATAPTEVAAQHVLVMFKGAKNAPRSVTRSKADARKRAEEARAKATSGTDFAKVVAEYSDDAATKERLGSVGKFARDAMTKPFSDAAFALPVDGISEVVETDFGFHVIKRNQ